MRRWIAPFILLLLAGCTGPQNVLDPASDEAGHLHGLMDLMVVVCGLAYVVLMGFLVAALWRARRRLTVAPTTNPDDRSLNRGLGAWIAFTATGLIVLAGASFLVDRALAGKALASEPTVRVTGQQWWWRIEYRDPATGQRVETANELHLPLNTPTRVQILSADVIHSFWVPNLSGKIDMVTGRSNEAAQLAGGDPSRGRIAIQAQGCGACHEIPGIDRADGTVGPSLKKIAIQSFLAGDQPNDPAHMTAWVQHPQGVRPGVGMPDPPASDATVRDMVAYLYTLRK